MSDFWDYICSWSALKWIVIVLIAGFIGQFGKMLAQVIVRKISFTRMKKQDILIIESPSIRKNQEEQAVNKQKDIKTQEVYPDKKALKIASKASKKSSKKSR